MTVELVQERPDSGSLGQLSRCTNVRIVEDWDGFEGARTSGLWKFGPVEQVQERPKCGSLGTVY